MVDFFGQRRFSDPYKGDGEHPLPEVSWWRRMPLEAIIIGGGSFVLGAAIIFVPMVF